MFAWTFISVSFLDGLSILLFVLFGCRVLGKIQYLLTSDHSVWRFFSSSFPTFSRLILTVGSPLTVEGNRSSQELRHLNVSKGTDARGYPPDRLRLPTSLHYPFSSLGPRKCVGVRLLSYDEFDGTSVGESSVLNLDYHFCKVYKTHRCLSNNTEPTVTSGSQLL